MGQERIAKADQARKETERILAEQQAEVARKKADMVRSPDLRCCRDVLAEQHAECSAGGDVMKV